MAEDKASQAPFFGFSGSVTRLTKLPDSFFTELLGVIEDIGELKVVLYTFWYVQQLDGDIRFLRLSEAGKDQALVRAITGEGTAGQEALQQAFTLAVRHNILLEVREKKAGDSLFFINTPRNRAVVEGYAGGAWTPDEVGSTPLGLDLVKPEIFSLYEQNIGMITPLIADQLKLAESEYPADWISDAIRIAVENNVRRWSYVQRILESWRERGRNG